MTTFDIYFSRKRTGRIRDVLKFSWKWQKWLQNLESSNRGFNTTRNHHESLSLTHRHIRKLYMRSLGRPGKSYLTATFWYFQKKALQGCLNGCPGPHFGQNLQNGRFSEFFDSRFLIYWKNRFFWYMGRGGFINGLVPKIAEIEFQPVWAIHQSGPSYFRVQNPPKIFHWDVKTCIILECLKMDLRAL